MSLYKDASLVMLPSAYKDGKLYSIRPTDGSGDFTFSRGTNLSATRVDASQLIEKGRENLNLHSQDLTNPVYISGGSAGHAVVRTANYGTAPDGTQTADRIQISRPNGNTYAELFQRLDTLTGRACVISFYGKSLSGNATLRGMYDSGYLEDITFTTEWQRFEVFIPSATNSVGFNLLTYYAFPSTSQSADVLIWGVQAELGLVATPYIETGATSAQAGILENTPRLDYSGGASCPSLLLEPSRTNSQSQSEYLSDTSAWGLGSISISSNATTSPDGYTNAAKVVESATTARHELYGKVISYSGTSSISFFAKAAERRYLSVFVGGNPALGGATFDVQDGLVTDTSGGTTSSIEDYGNGWYRCSFTSTFSASTSLYVVLRTSGAGVVIETYAGDGTSGLYFWGAQVETNASYPTSYIPTYGVSQTRAVDFNGADNILGTAYSSNDFSYFTDFKINEDNAGDNAYVLWGGGDRFSGVTFNCYLRIGLYSNGTIGLFGHGDIFMASAIGSMTKNTRYKLLVKRSGTTIRFFLNGAQIGSDGNSSVGFTLRSVGWGYGVDYQNVEGNINQFLAFETALTDAECIALTTI